MEHTLRIHMNIPKSRRVEITLPTDVPAGDADVTVTVTPATSRKRSTAQDLLNSEVFGMWADRDDIEDSVEFASELRERAWRRRRE